MIKTYGRINEKEMQEQGWTYKKTSSKGYRVFVSPDCKYKACLWPNTISCYIVKNKWYIRG